jgi:hypothetical protein
MDLPTRLEIVKLFYASGESPVETLRAYKARHSLHKDPFPLSTITRLVKKFETTYSLHDQQKAGRPSNVEDNCQVVEQALMEKQSSSSLQACSTRDIEKATGISKSSVHRILRHFLNLYPYHLTLLQDITQEDRVDRVQFSQWMLENQRILTDVLWSDEAYFSLDGHVNRHSCIIWGSEKPTFPLTESLHSPKVCVWMGFTAKFKLRPFFFESTVTGTNYLEMLEHHVIPQLKHKRVMRSVVFQHDGAPPHFAKGVREYLTEKFTEGRVIGRGFPQHWPARSPDLSPLDYWFWSMVKNRTYHNNSPESLEVLKQRIVEEIEKITIDELWNAVSHLLYRVELVIEENGGLIEHKM